MIRLNELFGQVGKIASAFAILGLLVIASCSKDEEGAVKVATVEFANEAQTVAENGAPITINIPFSRAAGKDGTITVVVTAGPTAEYGTHYTTSPNGVSGSFDLAVSKGQTSAQFTFSPVNNALLADDKTVILTIEDVSSGFEIGAKDLNTITITDDEGPTQVNFAVASSSTAEDLDDGIDVTLNLSAAAPGTGTVTVAFTSTTAVYTTNFTTEPAATAGKLQVAVAQGVTTVKFKVKPVDDGSVNAARVISFTLDAASGAVVLGTAIATHTFTITDDETPSVVTFAEESSTVSEGVGDAGISIPFTLAPQTNGSGTVVVTFTGGTYGEDFTTDPAAVSGEITVPVLTAATTASFKVIPINNDDTDAAREITFTISEGTGVVTLGSADLTHELTITDDDLLTTIAAVRAAYSGPAPITSSLRIRGVVTSSNPQVNTNNIWVQDATAGIVIRLVTANNNAIERGDEVTIELNGGDYFEFNGLLQVQNVPNANVTVDEEGVALPTPEVITVAQLNSGAFEGKLVRLNDVAFVDANGTLTMSGTRAVSNGTLTTNVRTETGASHASSIMPYGFGTITGLAAENVGTAQIIPIVFAEDVFASNPVGTINVNQAITDFGSVNNGAESASQQFTVTGTTLTQSIVVTASGGFEVSTNNIDFTPSVTLPNTGGTVHARFAPASGTNQAINGTIVSKSLGAASVSFNVSGTETGNAASPLALNENFNYGGSDNGDITAVSSWTRHSGAAGPQYTAAGLTYTGHPTSGVGGAIAFTFGSSGVNDGDVNRSFTKFEGNGSVYVSFLINISAARATSDYFFHLGQNVIGTNFRARLHGRSNGAGWSFGLQKNGETRVDDNTVLNLNQTYLVVMKYTINTATATDDLVTLYVFDSGIPASEPGTPLITIGPTGDGGAADIVDIGSVAVRQSGNSPTGKIDAIRVAANWADLFN